MSARSGLVGKKSSRPYLGPSEAIFSMDWKNPKNCKILHIFAYFPGVGPLLLSTRGGGIGMILQIFVLLEASKLVDSVLLFAEMGPQGKSELKAIEDRKCEQEPVI